MQSHFFWICISLIFHVNFTTSVLNTLFILESKNITHVQKRAVHKPRGQNFDSLPMHIFSQYKYSKVAVILVFFWIEQAPFSLICPRSLCMPPNCNITFYNFSNTTLYNPDMKQLVMLRWQEFWKLASLQLVQFERYPRNSGWTILMGDFFID